MGRKTKLDPAQNIQTYLSPHNVKNNDKAVELKKILEGLCEEMEITEFVLHFIPEYTAVWARLFPNALPGQRAEINFLLTPDYGAFFVGHPSGRDTIVVHARELSDPKSLSVSDMKEGLLAAVSALLGPVDTEVAGKLRLTIQPWHVGSDD